MKRGIEMNYAEIKNFDIANGLGVRVSLFVSGCTHHCKNCFNQMTWDFKYGKEFNQEVEDLINKVQTDEQLKNFAPDLMKVMFGLAQVRHLAILTMIDDDVYDIGSAKFENLKRNKIVHFDNLTTLYNESNARVRYFTPEEEPQLTQRTVLVDIDDESIIQAYENEHIHQEESEDLTSDFFTEVKGKPYTLKRK